MLITLLYVYFIHRQNDWFVCHSDKVEVVGSTPTLWTILRCGVIGLHATLIKWNLGVRVPSPQLKDTFSNSKAHYW